MGVKSTQHKSPTRVGSAFKDAKALLLHLQKVNPIKREGASKGGWGEWGRHTGSMIKLNISVPYELDWKFGQLKLSTPGPGFDLMKLTIQWADLMSRLLPYIH